MKVSRFLAPTAAALAMLTVAAAGNTMSAQVQDTTKQIDSTEVMPTMPATPTTSVDISTETGVTLSDSAVIAMLQVSNAQQVAAANLAIENSENAKVRAFAQELKSAHLASQSSLKSVANRLDSGKDRGMAAGIPTDSMKTDSTYEAPAADAGFLAPLEALEGHEFDHGFVRLEIDNHEKLINKLQTEVIPGVKDAQLKSTLEAMVPKLKAHLRAAVELEKALGSGMPEGAAAPNAETAPDSTDNY